MISAYPNYRDTDIPWIRRIPLDWKILKARRLFKKMERQIFSCDETVTCFRDGTVTLRKNRRTKGFTESLKEIGYQGIRKGDLVIHQMDAFAGAIGVSDSDGKSTPVYSACRPLRTDSVFYYAYLLREMARTRYILSLSKGIRERTCDFRFDTFSSLLLPVPSQEEQEQIVRFLDWQLSVIDRLIHKKRKLIILLDEQKKVIINTTFRFVSDSGSAAKHETSLSWMPYRFRFLFELRKGLSITKADLVANGVPCVNYGQIHSKYGYDLICNRDVLPNVPAKHLTINSDALVEKGDFVFCDTSEDLAGCGNCVLIRDLASTKLFAGSHTIIAHPVCKMDSSFLMYLFKCSGWRAQIQKNVNGIKVYSITQSILKRLSLNLPSLKEQAEIAQQLKLKLARLDSQTLKLEQEIRLFREYRTRLIADVVTGKIDIRGITVLASIPARSEKDERIKGFEEIDDAEASDE